MADDLRWYMLTRYGAATLCVDRADAEREAKLADMAYPTHAPHIAVQLVNADALARKDAEIAALKLERDDYANACKHSADDLRARDAEIAELRKIAELARKACWLQAACWDLADGLGVFISTESMKRFDEVFTGLGVALGDIVVLDEDAEADMFSRPSELLARAERAEERIAGAPVVEAIRNSSTEAAIFARDLPAEWIGKRVAIVLLDAEDAK